MKRTPLPVLAVWDETADDWTAAPSDICVARWASSTSGHPAGSICGDPGSRKVGDVWLCDHHFERALDWRWEDFLRERAADIESGWSFEARQWDADAAEVVYYLLRESDGLIKIGTSGVFRTRLSALRCEHGPLRILATHRGDRAGEQNMHARFKDLRVDGEWFRPDRALVTWILEIRKRQAKIQPPTLISGTVALSEVEELAKAARRRPKRVA